MLKNISTALWVAIIFIITIVGLIVYVTIQDADVLDESNIRNGIIDIGEIDKNSDGFVYQDSMHLNVISDDFGICPLCFMNIDKVTNKEAIKKLKDNFYEVRNNQGESK
jgi:hypothetical protein